jgi:hypothetical protein
VHLNLAKAKSNLGYWHFFRVPSTSGGNWLALTIPSIYIGQAKQKRGWPVPCQQAPKFNLQLGARYWHASVGLVRFTYQLASALPSPLTSLDMDAPEKPVSKQPDRPILPTYSWRTKNSNAQLFYITDHRQVDLTIPTLPSGPLGFDLEWRPTFNKGQLENPVALVQLSNEDKILLIQISAMTGMVFKYIYIFTLGGLNYFQNFLANFVKYLRTLAELKQESVFKVCVTAYHLSGRKFKADLAPEDCKKLYADWGISVCNCVDLSLLARCVDNARWKGRYVEPIGLRRLVETYEQLSLPKGKIQRSNWEAQLSTFQQHCMSHNHFRWLRNS